MEVTILRFAVAAGVVLLIIAVLMSRKKQPRQDPESAALLERRLKALRDNPPRAAGPLPAPLPKPTRRGPDSRRKVPPVEAEEPLADARSAELLQPPGAARQEEQGSGYKPRWKRSE